MSGVVTDREVLLYGTRFPINGAVRHTMITPFPPKITFGDYTRDDQTVLSTWLLTRFNGGLGIEYGEMPRHQDRYRFGDLETRYRFTTLGPLVTLLSAEGADARVITEYAGSVIVATTEKFYKVVGDELVWFVDNGAQTPSPIIIEGTPVAANVFNGVLYFQTTGGMYQYDSELGTWQSYDIANNGVFQPSGVAAIVWDDKYFRLDASNVLYYHTIPASAVVTPPWSTKEEWTEAGRLHLPSGHCEQLVLYFDLTGEIVIHAITKIGVFAYDFGARKFYPTALAFPYTDNAGHGAIMWRGELHDPAAASIYKYNGSVIQNVGPSKDDGLPSELHGDVVSLVEGHGFYFSVLQAKAAQTDFILAGEDDVRFGGLFDRDVMAEQAATQGAILCSPGSAWHTIFYESAGARMGAAAAIATTQGYRLWFSTSNGLYYIDLSTELHNPLQSPTAEFKQSGFLETVWTDAGWAEIDKTAFFLDIESAGCSDDETITFSAAYDDSNNYELLGTVTTNGRTVFNLGGEGGKVFRSIRFRIEMARGADPKKTPVMKSAALAFLRRPEPVWGYEVDLQLTHNHNGMTARELIDDLVDRIAIDKQAGQFTFRDEEIGEDFAGRVVLTKIAGAAPPGLKRRGRYTVALLEVKEPR